MAAKHVMTSDGLFTVEGTARMFNVSESMLRNHIQSGKLPVVRSSGRRIYLKPEVVRAFAARYGHGRGVEIVG